MDSIRNSLVLLNVLMTRQFIERQKNLAVDDHEGEFGFCVSTIFCATMNKPLMLKKSTYAIRWHTKSL